MKFIHITDTHFTGSSNTRVGDYLEDLLEKFRFVVARANTTGATLLHSGDIYR
jgi:DNA repair exonuclease SbcCD nuclease subunit